MIVVESKVGMLHDVTGLPQIFSPQIKFTSQQITSTNGSRWNLGETHC